MHHTIIKQMILNLNIQFEDHLLVCCFILMSILILIIIKDVLNVISLNEGI